MSSRFKVGDTVILVYKYGGELIKILSLGQYRKNGADILEISGFGPQFIYADDKRLYKNNKLNRKLYNIKGVK